MDSPPELAFDAVVATAAAAAARKAGKKEGMRTIAVFAIIL